MHSRRTRIPKTCSLAFFIAILPASQAFGAVSPLRTGIDEVEVLAVKVVPDNAAVGYAGTSRGIYQTHDSGKNWKNVLVLPLSSNGVRQLTVDAADSRRVYAATDIGLYRSVTAGDKWRRIFRGIGASGSRVNTIALDAKNPHQIYVGTDSGIFLSKSKGRSFEKLPILSNERILRIEAHPLSPRVLLVMTEDRLYLLETQLLKAEPIFIGGKSDEKEREEADVSQTGAAEGEKKENDATAASLSALAVDQRDHTICIGTFQGVFLTEDDGRTWSKLSDEGMPSHRIYDLVFVTHSPSVLWAATDRGIFTFESAKKRWETVQDWTGSEAVWDLDPSTFQDGAIWAATSQGVVALRKAAQTAASPSLTAENLNPPADWQSLLLNFKNEPTIQELHQAAMHYAEVHPDKILKWRRGAQRRALMPTLSLGGGQNVQRLIELDRGGTSDPDLFITGPQERKLSFDVKLSWDLADLVWSPSQTTIDVRSKLMVELRDDLLNSLTKYYFERRRLQIELIQSPPQNPAQQLEKELRLQELTAHVDALTGDYLSRKLGAQQEGG